MKQRDLEIIEAALQTVERPDYVVEVTVRLDDDWSGDPAAMIRLLLKDEIAEGKGRWDVLRPYEKALQDAVLSTELGRWPYVNIWTESERREEEAGKTPKQRHRPVAA